MINNMNKLFFFLFLLSIYQNNSFSFINDPDFTQNYFHNDDYFLNIDILYYNSEFSDIQRIDSLEYSISDDSIKEEIKIDNPNESRMFVMPTAKPVRSGQGYLALNEFVFPTITFGIENVLSFTAGISILFGSENQLIHLAPKITVYNSSQISIATGLFYVRPLSGTRNSLGIIYGMGTYDYEFISLTFGGGYGFEEDRFSKTGLIIIGGEIKIFDGFSILSENWYPFKTDEAINSYGIRFYGGTLAFDIGFVVPQKKVKAGIPKIPWVALVYNF